MEVVRNRRSEELLVRGGFEVVVGIYRAGIMGPGSPPLFFLDKLIMENEMRQSYTISESVVIIY